MKVMTESGAVHDDTCGFAKGELTKTRKPYTCQRCAKRHGQEVATEEPVKAAKKAAKAKHLKPTNLSTGSLEVDEATYIKVANALTDRINEGGLGLKFGYTVDAIGTCLDIVTEADDDFRMRVWAPAYNVNGDDEWVLHFGNLTDEDGTYEYVPSNVYAKTIAKKVTELFAGNVATKSRKPMKRVKSPAARRAENTDHVVGGLLEAARQTLLGAGSLLAFDATDNSATIKHLNKALLALDEAVHQHSK